MNKSLSLFLFLSLALPLNAMEATMEVGSGTEPQQHISAPRRLANRVWKAVTCQRVFITVLSLAVISLISTGGYFVTNTCMRMENACNNCTNDFTNASCGLNLLGSSASLLKKLLADNPTLALKYASELSQLNVTCN
jgi:hypothetical protein